MSIYLARNGKMLTRLNGTRCFGSVTTPFSLLLEYEEGVDPGFGVAPYTRGFGVQVSESPNVWLFSLSDPDWSYQRINASQTTYLLPSRGNIVRVLGGNTTGVTNMTGLFYDCEKLVDVALFDTSTVTNMRSMFYTCRKLTTIPAFDTRNVTSFRSFLGMYQSISSITSVPLLNTSSATDTGQMFEGCRKLTSVPLLDLSNVTQMDAMFSDCRSLASIPDFDISSATNMKWMFRWCYGVESGALSMYQKASSLQQTVLHNDTFLECGRDTVTGAAELAQIPTSWGGTLE